MKNGHSEKQMVITEVQRLYKLNLARLIKEQMPNKTQTEVAEGLGFSQGFLSKLLSLTPDRKKTKNIGAGLIDTLCKGFGVSESEFRKEVAGGEENKTIPKNTIVRQEHKDIIEQFDDKELAKEINFYLVEIERINPEVFKSIADEIRGSYKTLKIVSGQGDKKTA